MKWITLTAAALVAAAACADAALNEQPAKGEQQAQGAQPAKRGRRSRENTGGFIVRPAKGKVIRFANAQSAVQEGVLKSAAEEISQAIGVNIDVSRLEDANASPASLIDAKTGAAVVLRASGDSSAATIMVAPENGWAVVDVGALAKDGAGAEVLAERVRKELWRTTAIMLGASDSTFKPCLLEPVHSLAALDALKAKQVCPEPYGNIQRNAKDLGCGAPVFTTYRVACREGWAPAPTNDVQRAIWEETRKLPTKPIKIEFDPKKGK